MSTRAQIALEIGPGEWAQVYVYYDGYPSHMLPALEHWKPEDILAAREIRHVTAEVLDCFDPPSAPPILPRPTRQFCQLYGWQDGAWAELDPETNAEPPRVCRRPST
jgi:hypothetical protein